MNTISFEQETLSKNESYIHCEGFGKCCTCNQLSAITYTVNYKGQVIEDSKKCFSCIELGY